MSYLSLPLAVLLGWLLGYLPHFQDFSSALLLRLHWCLSSFLKKHAPDNTALAAPLTLLFVFAFLSVLGGLLAWVHPLLPALLLAPVLPLGAWLARTLKERAALEEGSCTTDAQRADYERRVRGSIARLARLCATRLCVPLLACCILSPFDLSVPVGWLFLTLQALRDEWPPAQSACAFLERVGEALFVLLAVPASLLCGTEMGMAYRARFQGAENVLLSSVGIDPQPPYESGHAPVTGDISQACLVVCIAMLTLFAVLTLPVALFWAL